MLETLNQVFEDALKDMFNAEHQFLHAMQKMASAADSVDLQNAITEHISQTEEHVRRLGQVADILETTHASKICKAAHGLTIEGNELVQDIPIGPVRDAAIIMCLQQCEHHEICTYGTLLAWARELGMDKVVPLLERTLAEERQTNDTLNRLALVWANVRATTLTGPGSKARVL